MLCVYGSDGVMRFPVQTSEDVEEVEFSADGEWSHCAPSTSKGSRGREMRLPVDQSEPRDRNEGGSVGVTRGRVSGGVRGAEECPIVLSDSDDEEPSMRDDDDADVQLGHSQQGFVDSDGTSSALAALAKHAANTHGHDGAGGERVQEDNCTRVQGAACTSIEVVSLIDSEDEEMGQPTAHQPNIVQVRSASGEGAVVDSGTSAVKVECTRSVPTSISDFGEPSGVHGARPANEHTNGLVVPISAHANGEPAHANGLDRHQALQEQPYTPGTAIHLQQYGSSQGALDQCWHPQVQNTQHSHVVSVPANSEVIHDIFLDPQYDLIDANDVDFASLL